MKKGVAMKSGPVVYLLVIVTSLLLIPSASATWSGFRSMGTTVTLGEPSCVQVAAQDVVCVAQSQQSTLMTNRFIGLADRRKTCLPFPIGAPLTSLYHALRKRARRIAPRPLRKDER
jgi:hypothetical protein